MALSVTSDLVGIIKKAKNYQRKYESGKKEKYLEKLHDCKEEFYFALFAYLGKFKIRPQYQSTIDRLKIYQALSWASKPNLDKVEDCLADLVA